MSSIANELSLLNEQLVNHEKRQTLLLSGLKENEKNLGTLFADDTRAKNEKNTFQHDYSSLNQEKYTLEIGIR